MLLGEELAKVAFASFGKARKELLLLESEMARHVVREVLVELAHQPDPILIDAGGRSRPARKGGFQRREKLECAVVLLVEEVTDLVRHARPSEGSAPPDTRAYEAASGMHLTPIKPRAGGSPPRCWTR